MKQAENYNKSRHAPKSWILDPPESYVNYTPKKNQSIPTTKSNRFPTAEPVAGYYSSTNSYKLPHKNHGYMNSSYSKFTSPHAADISHQVLHNPSRLNRDKHYTYNVAPTTRKNRYVEELGNLTEDNGEEDGLEEVEDEETGEFLEKDFEAQEADDEIDEDSDSFQHSHRVHRADKKELTLKVGTKCRTQHVEQQQEPRRIHYQQRPPLSHGHSSIPRYCRTNVEHDIPEPNLSEEEYVPNIVTSQKSPTRKSFPEYYHWGTLSRSSTDRYDTPTLSNQSGRRARTKPEMDHLKCSRCGSISNKKNHQPSNRNNCRFVDRSSFPTKGPTGDEPEIHEQNYCGRCTVRHNAEDINGASEIPPGLYAAKPRRSRDVKSPVHEVTEQGQISEKISNDYTRSSSRYPRNHLNSYPEKVKCSAYDAHVPVRATPRYPE